MVSRSILVVLCGLAVCSAQSSQKPECSEEVSDFGECMRKNGPERPKMDFEAIKTEADKCFKDNGCSPPDFSRLGQGGPGGRAGPPPAGGAGGEDKCFQNVHEKLFTEFTNCMKDKDKDFGKGGFPFPGGPPPGGPPPGGPPPGFGPPPGGPPPGFGPPPGGPPPGGPGGFPPPMGPPSPDMLAPLCDNDKSKAKQLAACLESVHEKHKPSKDEVKKHWDEMCKVTATCKPKLGKCEDTLKKKGQYACECHEKVRAKADDIFKQESSCAKKEPPKFPGPPDGEKHDCSKPPPDPCDDFEKFYERFTKFPPPPPPPGPPPGR